MSASIKGTLSAEDFSPQLSCFPYAVGHSQEGVCLLVQMGEQRILLDCGLWDISPLLASAPHPPADAVICTHAHPDHARGLRSLHQAFPRLPIYASEVSTKLLPLNWLEAGAESANFCHPLPMRSPIAFCEGFTAELFPAGHLPGAAAIVLTYTTRRRAYRLLYTGDFFLSNSRLVEGLDLQTLRGVAPDILIVEGSYGDVRHPHRRSQENRLIEQIDALLTGGNSILMPVPTFGLAQEILVLLRSHHQFTGRDLDIWVGGGVTVACDYYLELLPHFPPSIQNFAKHQPLFWDERVRPRLHRLGTGEKLASGDKPCIWVTDDPQQWQSDRPENRSWVALLPEYPPLPWPPLNLPSQTYHLAQHSDGLGTTQLIHNLRPQHIVFVHGAAEHLNALTELEELQHRYHVHSPPPGQLVELPIGDSFIQPAAPSETVYEGEVSVEDETISLSLPLALKDDPRWQNFAETGVIEALWKGEELIIRSLSQRELLERSLSVPATVPCCGNCCYQKERICRNPASSLYRLQVSPEGSCSHFEPRQSPQQ